MGSSSSRHRRNDHHHHHHQIQPQSLLPPPLPSSTTTISAGSSSSSSSTSGSSNTTVTHNNTGLPSSSFALPNTTQPIPQPPRPPPGYPPSLPPPTTVPSGSYNTYNHHFPPPSHRPPPFNGWVPSHQQVPVRPAKGPSAAAPPPYVDHSHAKTVKNNVNVHKDSIKLVLDENNLESHLVSFIFDAVVDGSITIFYFAKEGDNCTFMPVYPDIYMPKKIPFKKGLGQKFSQLSGTGIDLGFFELDQLSRPSPGEDIFPLVISAEGCFPSVSVDEDHNQPWLTMSPNAQITQAVLEKNNEGHFQVKVIKQILWIDRVRYELREIYGIGNSDESSIDDSDTGKECVICMTEPKDTAVLPCRHMCLCSECANALRLQSDKCPICRQPIHELMEIKID